MQLARIDGSAVATHAHPTLAGWRLAICQPVDEHGTDQGEPVLAIDPLHAGLHTLVAITTDGMGTRQKVHDDSSPLRHMVLAIIDEPQTPKTA